MTLTPFLLNDIDFTLPKLPRSTQTIGEIHACGKVCTGITKSFQVTPKMIEDSSTYFDQNYASRKLSDDDKILNGLWMKGRIMAPFDLGASLYVNAAHQNNSVTYIKETPNFYVTWGSFMEISRYWSHVLSQFGIRRGAATLEQQETITVGTTSSQSHTSEVMSAWSQTIGRSLSGSLGLNIPYINAGIAAEMSEAATNSGSTNRTSQSEIGMSESETITQTFRFAGPLEGEPDIIDLAWWQLAQTARLGYFCLLSPVPFEASSRDLPANSKLTEWGSGSDTGWAELVQKFDIFEVSRSPHHQTASVARA